MPGIYVHIPFCRSKCSYCDFYSITNKSLIEKFINALNREIEIKKKIFYGKSIETIYFGGGTPSLLSTFQIESILNNIFLNFDIANSPEITFEANPDDLEIGFIKNLHNLGINRLSIGIQSLNSEILRFMRRNHNPESAVKAVINSKENGFDNISIDLIYGIDGLSIKEWEDTLYKSVMLPITHISAYHLGIEKGTLMYRQLVQNKIKIIGENMSLQQYETLLKITQNNGFEQYEISNFAKQNNISKHNSSYWNGTEYLGLGPSAHSFHNSNIRSWNISNVKEYINSLKTYKNFYEIEELSINDQLNERIMLKLRTIDGIDLDGIKKDFGLKPFEKILNSIKLINPVFYKIKEGRLSLTTKGMFVSDKIIESLFN